MEISHNPKVLFSFLFFWFYFPTYFVLIPSVPLPSYFPLCSLPSLTFSLNSCHSHDTESWVNGLENVIKLFCCPSGCLLVFQCFHILYHFTISRSLLSFCFLYTKYTPLYSCYSSLSLFWYTRLSWRAIWVIRGEGNWEGVDRLQQYGRVEDYILYLCFHRYL